MDEALALGTALPIVGPRLSLLRFGRVEVGGLLLMESRGDFPRDALSGHDLWDPLSTMENAMILFQCRFSVALHPLGVGEPGEFVRIVTDHPQFICRERRMMGRLSAG